MSSSYNDIRKSDIDAGAYNILLVTATDVETRALHDVMCNHIYRLTAGDGTYYLGQIGCYNIIHVQCQQMGSISPGGSSQTISMALNEWPQLKAVIMIGICFGFDTTKQSIGDVIVSTSIRNYETRRMGKEKEIPRGGSYQPDKCLLNAFKNLSFSWEFIGVDEKKKKLAFGECLSGEQLIDNKDVRDRLLAEFPEAKLGEMEGNGLVSTCTSKRIPWILVKAICDFADGNKSRNKKKRQRIAASSSARCCEAVLGQETAFESIGIVPVEKNDEASKREENLDVLFEFYKPEYASYYLHRTIDKTVKSYLSSQSLWIYGISGVGKSTSISHALSSMEKTILLVNMAGININGTIDDIFEWIYNEVAFKVGDTAIAPHPYQLCLRKIISMLDEHYSGQSVYLLVEEIPFSGVAYKTFVESFSSLVISDKLNGSKTDVHFVLSSIENPMPYVPEYLQKVKSTIKFLKFDAWTFEECEGLINLVRKNISAPSVKDVEFLISKCEYLPRPIKNFFREVYLEGIDSELDDTTINTIIRRF